ncbi:predicted protein [Plenodomus lingam JN3]|uniref:Predicted protein n=1 Tax=Leptosphaeria maculans (strain JN3 / isolate v23.1.3 / race Av1-4-5-6-7-8) TaxID=985895 RepID=E5A2N1_LEPMJ|nr:predicted protein [Plenodomus lingam JN3]CBX97827.1 predicted protein [Plenodomus lingam JN3]
MLAVPSHGTRLVFADADGVLKWVERDAVTPVRSFNINQLNAQGDLDIVPEPRDPAPANERLLIHPHTAHPTTHDDIVQKIVPTWRNITTTTGAAAAAAPSTDQENLVLWTGDGKLGLLGFGAPPFDADVWVDAVERLGGDWERERRYSGEMRRALEQQARELRWLRGYGLGGG